MADKKIQKCSPAGTRTRVSWVKAKYPNQLDYRGLNIHCVNFIYTVFSTASLDI